MLCGTIYAGAVGAMVSSRNAAGCQGCRDGVSICSGPANRGRARSCEHSSERCDAHRPDRDGDTWWRRDASVHTAAASVVRALYAKGGRIRTRAGNPRRLAPPEVLLANGERAAPVCGLARTGEGQKRRRRRGGRRARDLRDFTKAVEEAEIATEEALVVATAAAEREAAAKRRQQQRRWRRRPRWWRRGRRRRRRREEATAKASVLRMTQQLPRGARAKRQTRADSQNITPTRLQEVGRRRRRVLQKRKCAADVRVRHSWRQGL